MVPGEMLIHADPVGSEPCGKEQFLEGDEAKSWGLIDEVFDKRPDSGNDEGTGAGDVTPA